MLDMGFAPQLRQICSQIRPERQCTMWTATWPREVQAIAQEFTNNPIKINIGSDKLTANKNVKQTIKVCAPFEKTQLFIDLLNEKVKNTDYKIMVFANQKKECDRLTSGLRRCGINALALHGDKSQSERDYVMSQFRSGQARIICATDVAARGIDVSDVSM